MIRRTTCISLLLAAATALSICSAALGAPKKHLLVVTWTTGYRHSDSIAVAEPIIKRLGDESGTFDVDYARTAEDVKTKMSPEGLTKYDGVFFCQTTGDIGIPDMDAFLAWIKAGHAFIGTHSATDTYHNSPGYLDMIGGEFKTHGPQRVVEVHNEDPTHPAAMWLPLTFKVRDEIYEFKPTSFSRAKSHVILSMTQLYPTDPNHPNDPKSALGDYWTSWCRCYGDGKVFYTALGHRPEIWKSPWYQQHVLGGIEWALGLEPGSCTPSAELTPAK